VPHLRRSGENIPVGRELSDGGQRRRISEERRCSFGVRIRLHLLRVVRAAIVVAAWASGGAAANEKGTMVPSTRAPEVADNLPWNWRDGNCRIISETVTMVATDDVVPRVEVGIQGTRPRGCYQRLVLDGKEVGVFFSDQFWRQAQAYVGSGASVKV
jgi:hypothetical protein